MNKIRILPDTLANQIAAGEVVERPASVIKELIENSIDAGAGRIRVEIELGGRRLMLVSDDGEGMYRDDAILAFERHATSKIRELGDLGRIGTLGFRGEALASIASVAKVELITKTENETAATRVVIEGGRLIDVKDAPRSTGTTIAVRELFFNTPARRKFMRSEATENYHITSIIQHYSLAHPEIAFALVNNGREILNLAPANSLRERAFQVFGGGIVESLLPVTGGREYVAKVTGFVSAPRERRTNRDSQYFFVNHRFVRDKTISAGLAEGYRSVLPHGVYPIAFLFLELPLEEVDVNVHPAKTEVRFRRSEAVKDVIAETVRSSLAGAGIQFRSNESTSDEMGLNDKSELPSQTIVRSRSAVEQTTLSLATEATIAEIRSELPARSAALDSYAIESEDFSASDHANDPSQLENIADAFEKAANERSAFGEANVSDRADLIGEMLPVNSAARLVKEAEVGEIVKAKIQPIAQLHNSFIIAADDEGLLLIDQHVAHERILFDKYRRHESERAIESQNLLLPETVDLTPAQSEAFSLIEDELTLLGFGLMRLSGRTVAIRSIPTDLPPAEARNLFAEILDNMDPGKRGSAKSSFRDDIAASLACKAAVKINMKLTPEKMQWLIDRLLLTSSPTTCPHGRPVILRLSMKDIERGFHRT